MRIFSLLEIIRISIQNSARITISGKNEFILLGWFKLPVNLLCSFVWVFLCLPLDCLQNLFSGSGVGSLEWPHLPLESGCRYPTKNQVCIRLWVNICCRKNFCSLRPWVRHRCWEHLPAADSRCATWPHPSYMLGQDPMYTSEIPPTPWVPWEENLDLLRLTLWSSQVPSVDEGGLPHSSYIT